MNRDDVNWRGFWPAAPTPFTRDGVLDEGAWRELLRLYRSQGMHGILVNGTSGEWYAQSDAERKRVAEIATEEVGGRMTVVVGCTAYTADQVAELARHARSVGADGALSTPPPYVHPTADELVAFYRTIGDKADIPLMIYNWSRGVAVEVSADVALRLADIPNVVALKNSTADKALFLETLAAVVDRIRVFGDFVSASGIVTMRDVGGDGYISGGALLGAEYPEFFECVWRGDLDRALEIAVRHGALKQGLLNPDLSGRFGSPASGLKAAMNMLGQPGGYPRPPLLPVEDAGKLSTLREVLESLGLEVQQPVGAP